MIRLLIFLFTGEWKCRDHKWKIIKVVIVTDAYNRRKWIRYVDDAYNRRKWIRYYLQCKKCGDIKIKD